MNNSPLFIGLAAVLAGGVAIAAWQGSRDEYADVVDVQPVTTQEQAYAQVLSTEPVTDVVTSPRQICHDVARQERLPERDGNVGGTVAGALIGALAGMISLVALAQSRAPTIPTGQLPRLPE